MAKVLKSIKIDEDLLHIFDEYSKITKTIFGSAPTFTAMVEDGLKQELLSKIDILNTWKKDSISFHNGELVKYNLYEKQKKDIENLYLEILSQLSVNESKEH